MTTRAPLFLQKRNPDILTCIASLSNDEVFTPPDFANRMLDTVAEAWAADNDGEDIWTNSSVTFLDPCTKSGVFLREITRRLTDGLAIQIPDLQDRVNHILTKQVFGIGITRLTSLMARRSLYCSKHAQGSHSIANSFANDDGNIWYERVEHTWEGNRCKYCGASTSTLDRGDNLENYAYAFIHTDNVKTRISEMFGANMQFDVIIGNPPYQMDDEGGHRPVPLYHKFVTTAKDLQPRYLVMICPSRWMVGGLGLKSFRQQMLTDTRIRILVDFPVSKDVFSSVEIKGGVCYFLWDRDYEGRCDYSLSREGKVIGPESRLLNQHDILVRDAKGLAILDRVIGSGLRRFEEIVASVRPFGDILRSNFNDYKTRRDEDYSVPLLVNSKGRRREVWTREKYVTTNKELASKWKVFLPKAASDGGQRIPNQVIGMPRIGRPGLVSTETYLAIGPFESETVARSVCNYLCTGFARYIISLRKISQDNIASTFRWLPCLDWSAEWTDRELFTLFRVSDEEANHIEAMIHKMEWSEDAGD